MASSGVIGQQARPVVVAAPANPVAGAEFSWTPPVNCLLLSVQMILGTSANLARRTPYLVVGDGTNTIVVSGALRGQPPSTAVQYQWLAGGGAGVSGPMAQAVSGGIPAGLVLTTSGVLKTYTVGGTAVGQGLDTTDQYSFVAIAYQPQ